MQPREALEGVEAFASLDAVGFGRLERVAGVVHFPTGTAILREGESGEAFFVLLEGALDVEARNFADEPHRVARLGPGALFGEGSALTGEPRSATVLALEPVVALRFERADVLGVLQDYPEALEALRRLAVLRAEDLVESVSSS